MVALTGGPFLLADDLTALTPAERAVIEHPALLELVERAGVPGAGGAVGARTFRPVDLFERADPPEIPEHVYTKGPGIAYTWTATRDKTRVLALFNWDDEPVRRVVPEDFRGTRELWTGDTAGAEIEIPARGVRVLRA